MDLQTLYQKALDQIFLSEDEGLFLFEKAPLAQLMMIADVLRKKHVPSGKVTWIIDRNVNITNVCISRCRFCNFHKKPGDSGTYITSIEEYKQKIDELIRLGGDQLLLQGGLHPELGLSFYCKLFSDLKKLYPDLKLHALGPAEIDYLAKFEKKSNREILVALIESGMDSLPGAGAEILCNRVRQLVSPGKCGSDEWLNVMVEAHQLNILTSATMMFGHAETERERMEHLVKIRQVQSEKPEGSFGFIAFIPWPYQDENTRLKEVYNIENKVSSEEYIRMIAISRVMLPNIQNIQASWLTVGMNIAQICLYAGANDMGSIMIEENVVSSAGATHKTDAQGLQKAIRDVGFEPQRRNQKYEKIENLPR